MPSTHKPGSPAKDDPADPERSARFIETARQLGCEENLDRFDEAVKRIGRARRQPQAAGKAGKEDKPE
jgi:hypothetical protein